MNFPKISIITPSFNQGGFLETTIKSVLHQNYPNLEYIIIDGGSRDNSVDIIKKYEDKLTYWVSELDKGQTDAINKGLKLATGDIITWLNSDDYYECNTLDVIAKYWELNKFDFICGQVNIVDVRGKLLNKPITYLGKNNTYDIIDKKVYFPQPASFFSKSVIEKIGYLDESFHYAMDADYWIRANLSDLSFITIQDTLTNFRFHYLQKSTQGEGVFIDELIKKYIEVKNDHRIDQMVKGLILRNLDLRRKLNYEFFQLLKLYKDYLGSFRYFKYLISRIAKYPFDILSYIIRIKLIKR